MLTVAVGTATVVEIIAAYAAQMVTINAVTPGPGWTRIGAFWMPAKATVKLELIGLVSVGTNVLTARLYDVAGAAAVSGSTTNNLSDTGDARQLSGAFDLPAGKLYRIEAQVIGAAGTGLVISSSLING
jgi:hypothetical protein